MSLVLEASIPVLLERLVNNLISIRPNLLNYEAKIAKEIKKWCPILDDLRLVLEDAENKESNSDIEPWLQDLEDIALDVEDVLEGIECDIMQSQRQSQKQGNNKKRRCARLFSSFKFLKPRSNAVVELEKITARLNSIVERKKRLELLKGNAVIPRQRAIRDPSGPVLVEPKLYGREPEKKKIFEFLSHGIDGINVLPIVGAGGIGKTALLQHIYNKDEVVRLFELRAWVCISQEWNLRNIFKSILEDITGQPCELQNLDRKVHEVLRDKKFCIVLDDLWSDDILQWNDLRAPLMAGAPGSKVLVTTRKINVAHRVKTVDEHIDLSYLSKDDLLNLFCSYVGFDVRMSSNSKLQEIAENITQKCGGLPLAALIMGSHLRGNYNEEDWSAILNNKSIMLRDGQYKIDFILKMSYDDLPYNLKSCFLYCTIFPEDYRFIEADLVELWIAAGLIKCDIENVGHSYFMELVSRSLLTFFDGFYVMHDLIRDMGKKVSNNRYCRWENELGSLERIRHLSINRSMIGQLIVMLRHREEKTFPLRTLMVLGGEYNVNEIDDKMLVSKLAKLRVLQARELPIRKLSTLICKLKLLKYLDLQGCIGVTKLPAELEKLGSLQVLHLWECVGLAELPKELGKLGSLQRLGLWKCAELTRLPVKIGNLGNLQRLHLGRCTGLSELPTQIGSLGSLLELHLWGCTGLTDLPVELGNLGRLQRLNLGWCTGLRRLPTELGNLSNLQWLGLWMCTGLIGLPAELRNLGNLQQLILGKCTRLIGLPAELGNMCSLQTLNLGWCPKLTGLPMEMRNLGSLQKLNLRRCIGLTGLPTELGNLGSLQNLDLGSTRLTELVVELGNLSSLQRLDLEWCTWLERLPIELGNLSSLQELRLSGCTKLTGLPEELSKLGSLQKLEMWGCTGLTELPASLGKLTSLEQLDLGWCTGLIRLPKELGNLGRLQRLNLLRCSSLTELPAELGNLSNLQELELSGCTNLTEIPGKLGYLGSLQDLKTLQ